MNRKLSIALVTALSAGLPALAAADIPSQRDIDIYSVLGDNSKRLGGAERTTEPEAPEFAGERSVRQEQTLRSKLNLNDRFDGRFEGPGYRTP